MSPRVLTAARDHQVPNGDADHSNSARRTSLDAAAARDCGHRAATTSCCSATVRARKSQLSQVAARPRRRSRLHPRRRARTARNAASRSTAHRRRSPGRTSPTSRRSARIRRRSAAGTARGRSRSQQLPRGRRREHPVRRLGSVHRQPHAGRHHHRRQPRDEADRLALAELGRRRTSSSSRTRAACTIVGNNFAYNWQGGQNGYAVVVHRAQPGRPAARGARSTTSTSSRTSSSTSSAGINILGYDNLHPSQQTNAIVIRNNLFADIDSQNWGGNGYFALLSGQPARHHVRPQHRSSRTTAPASCSSTATPILQFTFTNNLAKVERLRHHRHVARRRQRLDQRVPAGVENFENVFGGGNQASIPAGNAFPSTQQFEAQFVSCTRRRLPADLLQPVARRRRPTASTSALDGLGRVDLRGSSAGAAAATPECDWPASPCYQRDPRP